MTVTDQPLVWFSIPVLDLNRAMGFYSAMLGVALKPMGMEGQNMAFFPAAKGQPSGALVADPGNHPSVAGTRVYLNGGEDLQPCLDRAVKAGGKVVIPKTEIGQNMGHFAHVLDSEGNVVGLYSPK